MGYFSEEPARAGGEKEPGKDNLILFVRPLHRPSGATKKAEVRAFSGLPALISEFYTIFST